MRGIEAAAGTLKVGVHSLAAAFSLTVEAVLTGWLPAVAIGVSEEIVLEGFFSSDGVEGRGGTSGAAAVSEAFAEAGGVDSLTTSA